MGKISISLRKSAWLLALLIITSALPASAQEEDTDVYMQEGQFKFEYSNDLNGYIISPNKDSGWNWDQEFQLLVPSIRLQDGEPVVALSGFGSLKELREIIFPKECHVKYICDNCFKYCKMLGAEGQALNLPESIETIGNYAFYECTGLRVVKFGSNLKSIGISCFEGCESLESIKLPKSLKVIREFAFRVCTGLQTVEFDDNINFYDGYYYGFCNNVFDGCESLHTVKLPKNSPGNFIIPMATFSWCPSLKSIEFPANTRIIEQQAFYRSGIENLDFTTITSEVFYLNGNYTFAACENLKTITAKGKVRFDGLYIFQDCKALETATFTGSGDDYTIMDPDIFKYCDNLKSVEFYHLKGNGRDNDMDSVFTGCKSLERVISTCPPEISKIGYSCFDGCTSLKTLSLPETEFAVNETAFRDCAALESFDFTKVTSLGKGSFSGCTALASTPGISKLTTITENAFQGCTSLTNLEFTDLTSIGPNAFNGCTALASVNFNSSSEDPITATIGTQAFTGCTALASLNFNSSAYNPPTVASEDAFDASHYATTKVNMPGKRYRDFAGDAIWQKFANLKHPEMYAYTSVDGGYSIRKGEYALAEDFTGMLEIPEQYNSGNVVAIAEGTFQGFTGLTDVTLPSGLTSIGSQAFAGCTGITTVINKAVSPLSGENCPVDAFDQNTYTNGTLNVPFGSFDAYKSFEPWSSFSDRIIQGFGERTLSAPVASQNEGEYDHPIELTLTNPNSNIGTIYYYIINEDEGNVSNEVHTVETYSAPIRISANCTVVAQISNDTQCSEPVSLEYTLRYNTVSTNAGLLSMEPDKFYQVNVNLQGVKVNGGVLYARTSETSAAPSKPNKDFFDKTYEDYDLTKFVQRDWVAIEGLGSEYEGFEVGTFIAAYDGMKLTPEVSTPAPGSQVDITNINTFGVANVFYGNYENTEKLGMANNYQPFFVKAKVNEVANFVGTVTVTEGKIELWGSGVCGKLNEKGLEIDSNGKEINASEGVYQQIEGVLVADAEANGGVKLVALSKPITPTGVAALKADGKATIYGTEGAVVVNGTDGKVMIFDAMGRMVKSVSAEGAATVAMPAGYYIVRTAGTAKAVIVK